ncbi:phosphate ABC transporter substrate-binding/OmpA family protein [Antarcticimicrobium luteum]|uniref:Cell envelope biogenesis protein OmpA n=1 Tax=Antarcticimicrobium luteum TaxID=2547397 RepID=A0A4R5UYD8_9RHOB|nr:phosphate ABC transporter substrate-binding/OmpA family protein [Antarcticimicrobium luteum]TDK44394.1 cell envelope biogenesis protein OmpA [Antarcticimicrobium luteum]
MYWSRAAALAALFLFSVARPVAAQDVTLTSPDGAVEITGTLLGFDGEFYRVDTRYGELTVDGSGVSCNGPGCPSLTDYVAELALSGSSTMAEVLLPALVEGFALRNGWRAARDTLDDNHFRYSLARPDTGPALAYFTFRVSNTDEGFADLLANEADIVLALREIRAGERTRAFEAGMGDMTAGNRSRVLALDAMVPVVAPGNPVRRISTPDLARIFAGEIANWSDLGGPDAPIDLHLPDAGSGLSQAVEDRLLRPAGLTLAEGITRHPRSSSLARAVSADPFAIGIASFAETGTARALTLTGACGFSLEASRRTIKTEDYPLTSPMFLYLPARRLPKVAREFLLYVQSPAAQIVIRRAGFVDQAPERIALNAQGDRFANAIAAAGEEVPLDELQRMIATLGPLTRLTTSFRFEAGSTRPDAQSRANIAQLARAIEIGVYDAKTLMFVGFSDGEGPAEGNRRIALKRAEAVRDAVLAAVKTPGEARVEMSVEAFGEALPMACDDSDWGRQVNRRVEIWAR